MVLAVDIMHGHSLSNKALSNKKVLKREIVRETLNA